MTLKPAKVPIGLQPDVLNHGCARAGKSHNLASIQVSQSTNPVHISRLQDALQADRSNGINTVDYLCR
jgi:hypothetical protein